MLDVFLRAAHVYGVPLRIRGDHGVENILLAIWMAERQGLRAYIWGRYDVLVIRSQTRCTL
jgi:hypothetical protein